jgi:hypothetical protein
MYFITILLFILGLYFATNYSKENFGNLTQTKCPTLLIQEGNKIMLYNDGKPEVPGINPIIFNNLEEYTEYIKWKKQNGIRCPILFLQKSYNTNGDNVYKPQLPPDELDGDFIGHGMIINNTKEKKNLMDANRSTKYFNKNNFPGFDPDNQYIGVETPLDNMYNETHSNGLSPNPMDTKWGGTNYTNKLIKSGYYENN